MYGHLLVMIFIDSRLSIFIDLLQLIQPVKFFSSIIKEK
ncbi:hypothetical protein BAXH7_01576 [Bacillus amyloliquefaciens XH7]|nr:hypothetical protein BAXH7_01576 [Bacillus amyloliquefaciens XH7]